LAARIFRPIASIVEEIMDEKMFKLSSRKGAFEMPIELIIILALALVFLFAAILLIEYFKGGSLQSLEWLNPANLFKNLFK